MWQRIASREGSYRENVAGLSTREVFDRTVKERIPLGREQDPEDVAYLAAFLASEYARNITGQAINVSGGSHLN